VNGHLSNVLSVVVLAVVGVRLIQAVTLSRSHRGRSLSRQVWTKLAWRHIWPVPFVLAGVLLVAVPLLLIPPLRWGWWSALGGDGNPIFGSSTATNGTVCWTTRERILKVLQFGLIHALIGIPIGVALALSVGGAYFMSVYLRSYALTGSANEATLESTRAHTAYNALIILTVAAVVAVDAVV
jgi:hypothetical protein